MRSSGEYCARTLHWSGTGADRSLDLRLAESVVDAEEAALDAGALRMMPAGRVSAACWSAGEGRLWLVWALRPLLACSSMRWTTVAHCRRWWRSAGGAADGQCRRGTVRFALTEEAVRTSSITVPPAEYAPFAAPTVLAPITAPNARWYFGS